MINFRLWLKVGPGIKMDILMSHWKPIDRKQLKNLTSSLILLSQTLSILKLRIEKNTTDADFPNLQTFQRKWPVTITNLLGCFISMQPKFERYIFFKAWIVHGPCSRPFGFYLCKINPKTKDPRLMFFSTNEKYLLVVISETCWITLKHIETWWMVEESSLHIFNNYLILLNYTE